MRLPDFCSDGWRTHALLLAWTVDPLFFETVTLRRLEMGGAHRVLVLADALATLPRVVEAAPNLRQIGKRWALAPVRIGGNFHPKLIARFGPEDAAVAILSGNLTPSGWGRNLEVGSQWLVGPGHADRGGWLAALLASAQVWAPDGVQRAVLDEIRGLGWIGSAIDMPGSRVPYLAAGQATLFAEVVRRWAGRRFSSACFATGSTDQSGAVVRALVKKFGISEAKIFVNEDRLSFVQNQVGDLPLTISSPPFGRTLHAKALWLSGPDGDAAAWGSANCSAAAWLLPSDAGGNVELMVLDDAPDTNALADLFGKLAGGESLVALPVASPKDDGVVEAPCVVDILEAEFRAPSLCTVRVSLPDGTKLDTALLSISSGGRTVKEVPLGHANSGELTGEVELSGHVLPLFASLRGAIAGTSFETYPIAVNQTARLLRSHLDADTERRLAGVSPDKLFFADREAVLRELLELANRELRDIPSLGRWQQSLPHEKDGGASAPALDPLHMICGAAAGLIPYAPLFSHPPGFGGYLSCFERLIWGTAAEPGPTEEELTLNGDESDTNSAATSSPVRSNTNGAHRAIDPNQRAEDAATLASIRTCLEGWIRKLSGDDVLRSADPAATAYRCATFIISITQAVCRARWIPSREAADIAVAAIRPFLPQGRAKRGLVAELRLRCQDEPMKNSFQTYIGSGRLLAAFVNALTAEKPQTLQEALERASVLARLRAEPAFVAQIDISGLEALCSAAPDARDRIELLASAPAVASAALSLDTAMREIEPSLRRRIGFGTQLRPDLFWSRAEGWFPDRALSTVMTSNIGWRTASREPAIIEKADAVMQAWAYNG